MSKFFLTNLRNYTELSTDKNFVKFLRSIDMTKSFFKEYIGPDGFQHDGLQPKFIYKNKDGNDIRVDVFTHGGIGGNGSFATCVDCTSNLPEKVVYWLKSDETLTNEDIEMMGR